MYTYDLVNEPWIPVVTREGRRLVSLRECLINAHRYLGLAVESPLETVAVFRQVLLPVYLDAVFHEPRCPLPRKSEQWAELWRRQELDARPSWAPAQAGADAADAPIDSYLSRYRDRFDVFGQRPFAQVAGLRTDKDETKPASLLIASAASGNNVPLFSVRTEADPPALSPAGAIRAVLATHCWDTAAIKSGAAGDPSAKSGKTTGNPTGPLGAIGVVLPLGETLAQTLLLHVPIMEPLPAEDRPQWRADTAEQDPSNQLTWKRRHPYGLLDLLTWQARRIRLVPEAGLGEQTVVRRVVLTAGDRLERTPQYEPHTAWRMSKTTKEQTPARHTAGQAAWRGMLPMLATAPNSPHGSSTPVLRQIRDLQADDILPLEYPLRALTVGVQYGNQSAVVEDVIVDELPVPVATLNSEGQVYPVVESMVQQADELRGAANRLGDDLRRAAGGDRLPWDKGQRVGDQMVGEFTPIVRRVLSGLQHAPGMTEEADSAWRQAARRIALDAVDPLINATPPTAFLGRPNKDKDKGRHFHRVSVAEAQYRGMVRKILGEPEPPTTPSGGA
jgi:CRISPR system Cascade subunit CasA